jgi:hypothetical protein
MLNLDYYDNLACDYNEKANLAEWSIVNEGSDIDTVSDIYEFLNSQGLENVVTKRDLFKSYTDIELLNMFLSDKKFHRIVFFHEDEEFILEAIAEIRNELGA